ncbi:uncharacterized protein LOC131667081 [Phymastichus coffea]|uniref:uncharacterized protein LOC131667081 n=1 Tax=Phymastichus coffea TaxID=108790 RepID=UPI00273B1690|nr:uncharacterized protein LOC131667081 [Phymastichus coffea]
MSTKQYPTRWKRAAIIPLSKDPNPKTPSDTRPIANLPHLAKTFDNIIVQWITDFLKGNNLISDFQSGFRKHYSTQTALLEITDIRFGFDEALVTILLLFNFKKAFDSFDYTVLLVILRELSFLDDGVTFIYSYITGRFQRVLDLDDTIFQFLVVTSGVPQSSAPGPIIFLLFISSLLLVLFHSVGMLLADDLQIYIQCKPYEVNEEILKLNQGENRVVNWSIIRGIDIHFAKTTAMLFGSVQQLRFLDLSALYPVAIGDNIIPLVSTVRDLGLILSNSLQWNSQVTQVLSRVHDALHKLRRRGSILPLALRKELVTALVLPHFDYACLVYCNLPDYLNIKLQQLLNQTLTTQKPEYLCALFPSLRDEIRRSGRLQQSCFDIPLARTATYESSFTVQAMLLWDSLPASLCLRENSANFRLGLLEYLKSRDICFTE